MNLRILILACLLLTSSDGLAREGNLIPPSRAIAIAQARHEGKVLSAELVRPKNGRPYYRVKILSNGEVRTVRVDAEK